MGAILDMATVAGIRRHDFQCRWDTETLVTILGTPATVGMGVTVDIRDLVAIKFTEVMNIARGTTQATWITTSLRWFLTVATLTMSPATMTCIVRATGTTIATDSDGGFPACRLDASNGVQRSACPVDQ